MAENQNIEYKESWRDEYMKWICGFANGQGGTLYIGVTDKGEVCGVEDAKRLIEELPNKVREAGEEIAPKTALKEDEGSKEKNKSENSLEINAEERKNTLKSEDRIALKTAPKTALKIALKILDSPNITIPELCANLNIARRTVLYNVDYLKQNHILRRIGPDKGGHWEVIIPNENNEQQ